MNMNSQPSYIGVDVALSNDKTVLSAQAHSGRVLVVGDNNVTDLKAAIDRAILKLDQENRDDAARSEGYANEADMLVKREAERTDPLKSHKISVWRGPIGLKPTIPQCGHKFDPRFHPTKRNCQSCWYTYFQTHTPEVATLKAQFERADISYAQLIKEVAAKEGEKYAKYAVQFVDDLNQYIAIMEQQEAAQHAAAKAEIAETMGRSVGADATANIEALSALDEAVSNG